MQSNAMKINAIQCKARKSKRKKNRAMKSKAKQWYAKQYKAMQSKAMQSNAKRCEAVQHKGKHSKTMQIHSKQVNSDTNKYPISVASRFYFSCSHVSSVSVSFGASSFVPIVFVCSRWHLMVLLRDSMAASMEPRNSAA